MGTQSYRVLILSAKRTLFSTKHFVGNTLFNLSIPWLQHMLKHPIRLLNSPPHLLCLCLKKDNNVIDNSKVTIAIATGRPQGYAPTRLFPL